MELRLCPVADPNLEVTQECLNRNVLIIDGVGSRYPVKTGLDTIFFRYASIREILEDLDKH